LLQTKYLKWKHFPPGEEYLFYLKYFFCKFVSILFLLLQRYRQTHSFNNFWWKGKKGKGKSYPLSVIRFEQKVFSWKSKKFLVGRAKTFWKVIMTANQNIQNGLILTFFIRGGAYVKVQNGQIWSIRQDSQDMIIQSWGDAKNFWAIDV